MEARFPPLDRLVSLSGEFEMEDRLTGLVNGTLRMLPEEVTVILTGESRSMIKRRNLKKGVEDY